MGGHSVRGGKNLTDMLFSIYHKWQPGEVFPEALERPLCSGSCGDMRAPPSPIRTWLKSFRQNATAQVADTHQSSTGSLTRQESGLYILQRFFSRESETVKQKIQLTIVAQ